MWLLFSLLTVLAAGRPAPQDGTCPSADGVAISYHSEGHGSPALLLVHCWACDRHLWDSVVPALADRHQVVTLDLAGHGHSGRNRKDWTIEAFGEDVSAVAHALGLGHAVLVGHSMGGPVCLAATRRMGADVVGIVPVDTLLDVSERSKPEDVDKLLAPFQANFKEASARFIRDYMVVPSTDPSLVERLVAKTQEEPEEIAVASLRSTWLYDAAAALKEVKVPIHAINGDKYPTNLAAARELAPQYEVSILKGVGHYLMLEDPRRFNVLLEKVVDAMALEGDKPGSAPAAGGER